MFFNIGKELNFDFPVHVTFPGICLSLDEGWKIQENTISKGLEDNFCVLKYNKGAIEIDCGSRRKFPIFYDNENVSNLLSLEKEHTSGESATFVDNLVTLNCDSESTIFERIEMSDNELFDYLYTYIDEKVKKFESDLPINFFPTGGADVSMLISFVLKHKKKYNLLDSEYKAMDYFTCHNRSKIGRFWAYRDIHYWREPSILLSGTHGDEMMLRNPQHAYMISKANNENILDELATNADYYHSHYFLRPKHKISYDRADEMNLSIEEIRNYILGRNSLDYQYWHMGNTLTWTPLNDLKITNILLNFSYQAVKKQLLDAGITKQIIARNNPDHLKLVSKNKNINHFNHLYKIFQKEETL